MTPSYRGPLPEDLWAVLTEATERGIFVQGNFARERALPLALAASLGWLTVISPDRYVYARVWRPTAAGLTALENRETLDP